MKIGLVSDVHSAPAPLAEAIAHFHEQQVDRILCAGDIAGYNDGLSETIDLLIEHDVQCIAGNHDESWLQRHADASGRDHEFLSGLPKTLELEIDTLKVTVVHAEPPTATHGGIKLINIEGDPIPERLEQWQDRLQDERMDVLIVGHTHQVYAMELGGTFVVNPGSSVFNHSCMILDLPDCTVQTIALSGQAIEPVWNWSKYVNRG